MNYKVGDTVFDGWNIINCIGSGASGTVYEVQKTEQNIIISKALKVMSIPPDTSVIKSLVYEGMAEIDITNYLQSVMDELKNEIDTMISLNGSPYIVSCDNFSIKKIPDQPQWDVLILMEKLTPLDKWVGETILTEAGVFEIALQLAQGLMIIEEKGLIHRDIKPENIFVSTPGKHMRYFKIGDFGIARAYDKATRELSRKGTPNYMAPEIFRGELYDNRVDIYSLGLVLYKLLNKNRLPFFPVDRMYSTQEEQNALIKRLTADEPIAFPVMASKAFGEIILKMISYEPEDRFQTAEELYKELKKIKVTEKIVWESSSSKKSKISLSNNEGTVLLDEDQIDIRNSRGDSTTDGRRSANKAITQTQKEIYNPKTGVDEKDSSVFRRRTRSKKKEPKPFPIWIIVLAVIAALLSIFAYIYMTHEYTLSVENGSGSGSYQAGESVQVDAPAKEGYVFKGWNTTGLSLSADSLQSEHIVFDMPRKNVIIKAEYEAITYSVIVQGGTGSGTYNYGEIVPIMAETFSNKQFAYWEVLSGSVEIDNNASSETSITVLGDLTISAVYDEIIDIPETEVPAITILETPETAVPETQEAVIPETQEIVVPETQETAVPETQETVILETPEMPVQETDGDWRNNLLKEEHGIVGELKANMQGTIPEEKVFGVDAWNRDEIQAVYVLDTLENMPEDAIDISEAQNGSVMGWLDKDRALYIAGNGGVMAPEDSNALFAWLENAKTIDFGGNLHTDQTTKMSFMFCACSSLQSVNLEGIVTDNVKYFTKVFAGCRSLRSLDLSEFHTHNALRFFGMFLNCESLETLDLTSFQSSKVDSFQIMFRGCRSLRDIYWTPQLFSTSSATNMGQMFYDCNSLEYVDVSMFDTSRVENMYMMFGRCFALQSLDTSRWNLNRDKVNTGDMFAEAYLESYYGRNGEVFFI